MGNMCTWTKSKPFNTAIGYMLNANLQNSKHLHPTCPVLRMTQVMGYSHIQIQKLAVHPEIQLKYM